MAEAAVKVVEQSAPAQTISGGHLVAKVLRGGTEGEILKLMKRDFTTVRHVKPKASRADSKEIYVLATGFKGKHTP